MATPPVVTSRTWNFALNEFIAHDSTTVGGTEDGNNAKKRALLFIVDSLIGLGAKPWTVVASVGAISGFNGSGNNWTDITELLWTTSATGRPWIQLRNTDIGIDMLIILNTTAGLRGSRFDIYVVNNSVAIAFAGGGVNARPTSADEIFCLAQSDSTGFGNWGVGGTGTNVRDFVVHVMHSDDGLSSRVLIQFNNELRGLWMMDALDDSPAGVLNPWVVSFKAEDASDTPSTSFEAAYLDDPFMIVSDNSHDRQLVYMVTEGADGNETLATFELGLHLNSYDETVAFADVGIASDSGSIVGYWGTVTDSWVGPRGDGFGGTGRLYGKRQWVAFGDRIFPWDGTSAVRMSTN